MKKLSDSYVDEKDKLHLTQTKPLGVESFRKFGKVILEFANLIEIMERKKKEIPKFPNMESLDVMTEELKKKENNE